MNYRDEVLNFACEGAPLLGILSLPAESAPLAVLVIVGGPQYRVGAHRQFVLLARQLAAAGYPVLRFDHRGVGDSTAKHPGFDQTGPDIQAAIHALFERLPGLGGVMLWGLCDAASAALIYHERYRDPRVKGLALINPWVRSTHTLARTHVKHYYVERLLQASFWRKLLRGQLEPAAWRGLWRNLRMALSRPDRADSGFQHQMAQAWQKFPGKLLLVLSEEDYTAKEFVEVLTHQTAWRGALLRSGVQRVDIAAADHTFSSAAARAQLERATLAWLRQAQP
jgi:exosortase A-associated hydrolase 1